MLRPRSARLLLLCANVSLAIGVPACALTFLLARRPDAPLRRVALALEPARMDPTVGGAALGRLFEAMEARRPVVLPGADPLRTIAEPPHASVDGDSGPLAGAWRYVFYILRQDPGEDVVCLERAEGDAQPPVPPRAGKLKQPSTRRVTLHPGEGSIDGARLGIEGAIQIVEANRDEIRYRVSGEPTPEPYRLGYRARSRYAGTGRLGPAP